MILKCEDYEQEELALPEGFKIRSCCIRDEKSWAKLEYEIGDFESQKEAEQYFISNYLKEEILLSNILFLINDQGHVIEFCIVWTDERNDSRVSSLHWLVVDKIYQGQGLGRVLYIAVMNKFAEEGRLPVYIHTQPWSLKGILLYVSLGFKIQRADTFSHYENQFDLAMETLRELVSEKQWNFNTSICRIKSNSSLPVEFYNNSASRYNVKTNIYNQKVLENQDKKIWEKYLRNK